MKSRSYQLCILQLYVIQLDRLKTSGVRFEEWCKAWKQFVKESSDIEPSLLAMNRWKWNDNMIELNEKFIVKYVKPPAQGTLMYYLEYHSWLLIMATRIMSGIHSLVLGITLK